MPRTPSVIVENGIIAGNYYDKYGTRNPIARYLTQNFLARISGLISNLDVETAHEVGCGEGHLSLRLARDHPHLRLQASDFSTQVIALAKENAAHQPVSIDFQVASLYELTPEAHSADLVLCCEVLEHLPDPQRGLSILARLARKHLLVTVPREPIWRMMNVARGKYLKDFGNTPGHIQHWSKKGITRLVGNYAEVVEVRAPLPWTVVLCRTN